MDRYFNTTDTGFFYGFEYSDDRPPQGVYVTGVGLTYDNAGNILGGLVTEIRSATWSADPNSDGILWSIKTYTDVNLTVAALNAFDATWFDRDNFTALSGINDTIALTLENAPFFGTETADVVSGDGFWDGAGGDDIFTGGNTVQVLNGGDGDDQISSRAGDDHIRGDAGNDLLSGGSGQDDLRGGDGDDTISGGADDDAIQGNAGMDNIRAGSGNDFVTGGDGADVIRGQGDDDILYGDGTGFDDPGGNDTLFGGAGNDALYGGDGADRLIGGSGNDTLSGDAGDDVLNGGAGDDLIIGFDGNDRMNGGAGNDQLISGFGDQRMNGGTGDDLLQIAEGYDVVTGGAGADRFEFTTEFIPDSTTAIIRDFNVAEDQLSFELGFVSTAQDQFDLFMQYASQDGNHVLFDASADANAVFTITLRDVDLNDLTVDQFYGNDGFDQTYF